MKKLRMLGSTTSLLALCAWSACGGDGGGGEAIEPERDASPPSSAPEDAGGAGTMDAGPRDPFSDIISGFLGDAGLSGITGLLGDAGLSGITGLFADGGFSGFLDGGFDPALICARAPQFCPDAGTTPRDAGADGGDAGAVDAGSPDAGEPDAAGGNPEAGSGDDASSAGADGGA